MIATKKLLLEKKSEPTRPLSIRLPESVWQQAHIESKRRGIPLNTFIVSSLMEELYSQVPKQGAADDRPQ